MTPDIQREIISLIEEAFRAAAERGLLPRIELPPVELAVPREKNKGDLASNIAMKSASRLKMAPARTASLLLPILRELISHRPGLISAVEADPKKGFLNHGYSRRNSHSSGKPFPVVRPGKERRKY